MRVAAMLAPITDEPIAGAHNEDDISWAGVALKLVIFGSFCAAIVFGIRALYAEAISPGLKYSIATAVVAGIVHALRDVMEHD